jgi:hypothetical protein
MGSKATKQQTPLEQKKKKKKVWNPMTKHLQHNIKEK